MQPKQPRGPQNKKSTTLPEFLRWLYLRQKHRRRYSRDSVRSERRMQKWCAVGFVLLMTIALTAAMTYTRLHYTLNPTVIPLPAQQHTAPIGNPALALEAVHEGFDRHLIMEVAGRKDAVLKLMPPLTIEEDVLREGLEIVKRSVEAVLN